MGNSKDADASAPGQTGTFVAVEWLGHILIRCTPDLGRPEEWVLSEHADAHAAACPPIPNGFKPSETYATHAFNGEEFVMLRLWCGDTLVARRHDEHTLKVVGRFQAPKGEPPRPDGWLITYVFR